MNHSKIWDEWLTAKKASVEYKVIKDLKNLKWSDISEEDKRENKKERKAKL